MADSKTTALTPFTPVLSDMIYGVDDPGGTPIAGSALFSDVRTLFATQETFDNTTAFAAATIDSAVTLVATGGHTAFGDGGGALYKNVSTSEPSHVFKVQSADGDWWEIIPDPAGVNVRQAGATGLGVVDESVAFQGAVDSGFDRVFVPAGTYLVHRVNITAAVHVTGVGLESVISHFDDGQPYDATYMSFEPEADNITIENLNFVGTKRTSGVNAFPYYHMRVQDKGVGGGDDGFDNFRIINCRFFGGYNHLKIEDGRNQYVSGCQFIEWDRTDSGDWGWGLASRAGNGQWLGNYSNANTALGSEATTGGDAFKISIDLDHMCGPFLIDGNIGINAHRDGLDINSASARAIVVSNNIFQNNLGKQLDLKKGGTSTLSGDDAKVLDFLITGNLLSSDVNDRSLCSITNNTGTWERMTFSGNALSFTVPSTNETDSTYRCLDVDNVDDMVVRDNTFTNADIGVSIAGPLDNIEITSNHFEHCNSGVITDAAANTNIRVVHNTMKIRDAAIDFNGGVGLVFMGNYIELITSEAAIRYAIQLGNSGGTCDEVEVCFNYVQCDDISVCLRPIDTVTNLRVYRNTFRTNNNDAIVASDAFSAGQVFDNVIEIGTTRLTVDGTGGVDAAWNNLRGSGTARPTISALKGDVVKNSDPASLSIEGWVYDGTNWIEEGAIGGANAGAPGTGTTAVEYGDGFNHITVLTMGGVLPAIAAGANAYGLLVYTFPAGVTRVKSVHMDVGIDGNETNIDADTPEVGVGSVIATGAVAVLNGTTGFDDYVTETTAANCTGTVTDFSFDTVDAGLTLNIAGGGAGKLLHLNAADTWAGTDTAPALSGTVTVEWTFLGT